VDSKVVNESDSDNSKSDEVRWMRFTLDTVGKTNWPIGVQGKPIFPDGFEELAAKLERPLHPPGRDVRCIVSVGMLTEGWDCNTVTHIVGLRPFMSQLLCEQVVGRGLRRASYELDEKTGKFTEEVATVFGVPFEVIQRPPAPFRLHPGAITSMPSRKRCTWKSSFRASKVTRRRFVIASRWIGSQCRKWFLSRGKFRPKSKRVV